MRQLLFWTPRILGVLLGLFVGLFALDVFNEGRGPWETALAFAIHLIPAAIVLGAVAVAWRWEPAGGAPFLALAVAYAVMTGEMIHNGYRPVLLQEIPISQCYPSERNQIG